ncbi:MAG: hypothetical protein ACR2N5_07675 [Solirubrobacterales bacterium]
MAERDVTGALTDLAAASAVRFRSLTEAGAEIPYEVGESDGTQLPQYSPMADQFVRAHVDSLRESEPFALAATAIGGDLAGRYLETIGVSAPTDPEARKDLALVEFLARVWGESSEFELDTRSLEAAVAEFEGTSRPAPGDSQLATPLIGLQLPLERVELGGATVLRADLADVPADARAVERSGNAPWEPVYLAVFHAPRDEEGGSAEPIGSRLRRLLTTLKLFKPGGVATGPHAWVSAGGEHWRRVQTGAPRPRPGGYRLAESELAEVADLARALQEHPGRLESQRRALGRFEAGLERDTALDSLNDYLLALRYMLEGDGPAQTGLAMRAAALSPVDERDGVKAMVERALALERELWSGDPTRRGAAAQTPAQVTADVENLLRRILTDVARGRLGSDLRVAADEALLGDGLAVGQGTNADLGGGAEWGEAGGDAPPAPTTGGGHASSESPDPAHGSVAVAERRRTSSASTSEQPVGSALAAPRLREAAPESSPSALQTAVEVPHDAVPAVAPSEPEPTQKPTEAYDVVQAGDAREEGWLDEVDDGADTLSWPQRPAALQALEEQRSNRPLPSERVTYLFPRTDTEWSIGELEIRRARRSAAS